MATEADPILENWYRHVDKGQRFQIIAVDEEEGLIEVQHFDGGLEELEITDWYQMELEPIEEPENWSGAVDIEEIDDYGTSVTDTSADDWKSPSEEIPSERKPALSSISEDEEDDWDEGAPQEEPWDSQ
jgi:hypothetical protein